VTRRATDSLRERLIVALDVERLDEADALVRALAPEVGTFKIGKQLFVHAGPDVVRMVHRHGREVFLDLKFHDIPTTVASAGVEAARLGVRLFDLHASGSLAMMTTTREAVARVCRREGLRRPRILAVTVLTSLNHRDLGMVGVTGGVENQVARLARLARRAGMDGVVASPLEIARIRRLAGPGFLVVTPGIRPEHADLDDQKRVMTPGEAMRVGADYVVVGRPIRDAPDPLAVARNILADMARGLRARSARTSVR
jgi:orotidine-5'-phosphate decarboxylase